MKFHILNCSHHIELKVYWSKLIPSLKEIETGLHLVFSSVINLEVNVLGYILSGINFKDKDE